MAFLEGIYDRRPLAAAAGCIPSRAAQAVWSREAGTWSGICLAMFVYIWFRETRTEKMMLRFWGRKNETTFANDEPHLRYSLSSKIFLSPPPALCRTFSKDRIFDVTSQSSFSSRICNNVSFKKYKYIRLKTYSVPIYHLNIAAACLMTHIHCWSHLDQNMYLARWIL